MKKSRLLLLICVTLLIIMMIPLGWAYYEYIGKYSLLINSDGTINQNAFGVLNDEMYRDADYYGDYPYGTSPENPFVVDNLDRLYNLIKLNNSGKLENSKISNSVYKIGKYYFVLDFTGEVLPQVLDLTGVTIESVGNNEHPFIDDLSGLLYAYSYTIDGQKKYIYLSGLIEVFDVTVENGIIYINGEETQLTAGSASPGEYIRIPNMYIYDEVNDGLPFNGNMYVPRDSLTEIHNVIANATVQVPDEQIDVGFFNCISTREIELEGRAEPVTIRGGVRDFILHNITINCVETTSKSVWTALGNVWSNLFGNHNRGDEYTGDANGYYERHIGLFAGHIDGNVSNITVSGTGNIQIDSRDVNYYSVFTTVGYIHGTANIGKLSFDSLIEAGIGQTDGVGVMFADSIYDAAGGVDGEIGGIAANTADGGNWGGVSTAEVTGDYFFKYGVFRFILSDNSDMVRKIWGNGNAVRLLNTEGYVATSSVLYCNDEYRYSSSAQTGGSLISSPASANETRYQGAHSLVASGSSLDKGNYVIAAKVPDGSGGYYYYALKIFAAIVGGDTVVHSFDTSDKHDITDYILGNTSDIYSSAIWQTKADSSSPKFSNMRFPSENLAVIVNGDTVEKAITKNVSEIAEFSYSALKNAFYYKTTEESSDGIVTVYHYLDYDSVNNEFFFAAEKGVDIEIFRLSNGFSLELVDDAADITANEDYLIVARSGGNSYLLGEAIDEESGTVIARGEFDNDLVFNPMPEKWSLQEYQDYRQYIWYSTAASAGSVTFCDKLSGMYYLAEDNGTLVMSTQPRSWTYAQNTGEGGTLINSSSYLNHSPSVSGTGFTLYNTSYTIYLYKLNADTDDMNFNTYQGAKLVTSDSSTVEAGNYLIAADNGTGLVMSGAGTISTADLTQYIDGSGTMDNLTATAGAYAGYKWQVSTTSSKPSLKNVGFSSYLSRNGDSTVAAFPDAAEWLYDATTGRLYYTVKTDNGGTITAVTYYLAYNQSGAGNFVITEGQDTPGYNYRIRLYKITYEYVYTDVIPVQTINYNDTVYGSAPKIYFLSTYSLATMGQNAVYILGAKGYQNESAVESVNISLNSTFNPTANTLTTTEDLAFYSWYLEPRILPEYSSIDIYTQTKTGSYFPAFQMKNGVTGMYLAASSAANSRTLVVATTPNMNRSPASGSSQAENNDGAMTAIGFGQGNSTTRPNPNGRIYHSDGTASVYVMGRSAGFEYYIWKTETPGVFALSTFGEQPASYTRPHMYQASGYSVNVYVDQLSEKGDNLDAGIHYMITAAVKDSSDKTQYFALSEITDENGNKIMTGINVTSQAETINSSYITDENGNIIEESSTDSLRMVPANSDWYQISNEKGLKFYQSMYSTSSHREYLSIAVGTPPEPSFVNIPVTSSAQPAEWYYDAISNYFKYYEVSEGVEKCYYLSYIPSTDTFYFTENINDATNFYIYRFKPTYVVTQITDASGESLKAGNFIVAYGSAGEYTAIGVNQTDVISKNLTDYLVKSGGGGLRDDLSETEYLDILNYIFKQQYYDFSGAAYNQSSPYLQLFSYVTGGGFTVARHTSGDNTGLQTGSNPMVWTLANSGGLWTFVNKDANSNDAAGTHGIYYNGTKSHLRMADGNAISLEGLNSTLTAKLFTYDTTSYRLTPATSISTASTTNYVVLLHDGAELYYAIMQSGTNFVKSEVTVTNAGSYLQLPSALATSYRFRAYSRGGSYEFRSRSQTSYRLNYNSGTFSMSTADTYIWTVNSSGVLIRSSAPATIPGYYKTTSAGTAVYMYEKIGTVYQPVNGALSTGANYAVVVHQGTTYFLMGHSGTALTHTSLGTVKPATIAEGNVTDDKRITAYDGINGVCLGFASSNQFLTLNHNIVVLTGEKKTNWKYYNNRLYTVSLAEIPLQYLSRSSSAVTASSTIAETWLYEALPAGSGYTLSRLESNMPLSGKNVIIVVYSSGSYYAVTRISGSVVATSINISGSNVTDAMVWNYDGNLFSFVDGGTTKYLRRTTSGFTVGDDKDIEFFSSSYTTYSFTSPYSTSSPNKTPLYIFRIDQSSEIDEVTDINSLLGSKIELTPSISLLESSKYMIVAEIDSDKNGIVDKYYSLGMIDANNTQALDITDIMSLAKIGSTVTVFDMTVWEQRGNDIRLIFDNIAFGGYAGEDPSYYLLTGSLGIRNSMEPAVVKETTFPADPSAYEWRAYSDDDGYLFGYTETSGGMNTPYYLFFDTNELVFKLSSSKTVAKLGGGVVQLYQLGVETVNQPFFITPIIETEEGSDIITSYPINKVLSADDLVTYSEFYTGGGNNGEYLIIAQLEKTFYALAFNEKGVVSFVDVSPYFSGNYSYDDHGSRCIAVNKRYIWLQTNSMAPGSPLLEFTNMEKNEVLGLGNYYFSYDFGVNQLRYSEGGTTKYLSFDPVTGFHLGSAAPSAISLFLYYLGTSGTDTGDGGTLNYTYYTSPLSHNPGSGVDFTKFEFRKKQISELQNFAVGTGGQVEKSLGWSLLGGNKLSDINTSVFFTKGITYNPQADNPAENFAARFSHMSSPYMFIENVTGDSIPGVFNYYAPAGTAAFAINEASNTAPVFVNVVVTTEFDASESLDKEILRYLSVWKVATLDSVNGVATTLRTYAGSDGKSAVDYAYTLAGKLNTPDFAIPLPHRYASLHEGASYAYVDGQGYELSDTVENYNECLIAHTFVITEPGLYYLGSTYGSVAISYISIENLAEGETAGMNAGSQFTVDFCWGDINFEDSFTFDAENPDAALHNLAYVGSGGWVHSNIFPEFKSGTAANLTDSLTMNVRRELEDTENGISRVIANTNAKMRIAGGVRYVNSNNRVQRQKRKVTFNVYCDGLDTQAASLADLQNQSIAKYMWMVSKNENSPGLRFYAFEVVRGVRQSYYLNVNGGAPSLSTVGNYNWTIDYNGYLKAENGYFLCALEDGTLVLSAVEGAYAVRLLTADLNIPAGAPQDGESYLLWSDNSYILKIIQTTED